MARVNVNGIETEYIQLGEQGKAVVLLHGWGQNIAMMEPAARHLSAYCRCWVLDFPGFGESDDPNCAWGVREYMLFLRAFIEKMKIETPILIGHSFGCRVAIHYAAAFPVEKMVLTGAAGLLPKRGLDYHARTLMYKAAKKITALPGLKGLQEELKKNAGSEDYRNASGVMRETFVKVVNDDVTALLGKINAPTLLIWGDQDDATPLWMGKKMEQLIPDAGLVIFEGQGHFAYFYQPDRFNRILDAFFLPRG